MYFLETLHVSAPCHGGVMYSFFILIGYCLKFLWIFKILKKYIFNFVFFSFHVFFAFYAISNIVRKKTFSGGEGQKKSYFISRFILFPTFKKIWGRGGGNIEVISGGGGGGGVLVSIFFLENHIISRFMLFPTFRKNAFFAKYWKVPLHLLINWLNGRWFLQIVDTEF